MQIVNKTKSAILFILVISITGCVTIDSTATCENQSIIFTDAVTSAQKATLTVTPILPKSTQTQLPPTPRNETQVIKTSEINGRVDVGGHQIYLICVGAGTPAVILEAGYGSTSDTWYLVQPEVAKFARVCAYDRAGLGRSSAAPEPENSLQVVQELRDLLDKAGIEKPYILVGHSLGGMYMRLFADRYPEDVVGLILVDSFHIDALSRNAEVLPTESPDESESLKFYRDWFTNPPDYPAMKKELFEAGSLGDLPLVVLTSPEKERADDLPAGLSAKFDEIWVELQDDWAKISSRSTHIIAEGSGHFIQEEQPDLVIDVIHQVLEGVRQ